MTLSSFRNADLLNLLAGKIPHPSKSDIAKRSTKYASNALILITNSLTKFSIRKVLSSYYFQTNRLIIGFEI